MRRAIHGDELVKQFIGNDSAGKPRIPELSHFRSRRRNHDPSGAARGGWVGEEAVTQLDLPATRLTGCERILLLLQNAHGAWVEGLYRKSGCMVHSRIADLRRKGHRIEQQFFKGKGYCYRLVEEKERTT